MLMRNFVPRNARKFRVLARQDCITCQYLILYAYEIKLFDGDLHQTLAATSVGFVVKSSTRSAPFSGASHRPRMRVGYDARFWQGLALIYRQGSFADLQA